LRLDTNTDLFFGTSGTDVAMDYNGTHFRLDLDQVGLPGCNFLIRDGAGTVFSFEPDTGDFYLDGLLYQQNTVLTDGFTHFRTLTQATYDGLTPDADTLYFING
jgi:hypothetical protein